MARTNPLVWTRKELNSLRACLGCSLIKSFQKFELDGCPNCEMFVNMKNNRENVDDCTSSDFEGAMALMYIERDANWERIDGMAKGIYAISVLGRLPASVAIDMKLKGIPYRTREENMKPPLL